MDASRILLILMLYTVLVALSALVYFISRSRRRPADAGLPIPNVAGLNLKSPTERLPFPWENAPTRSDEPKATLDHESFEQVGITPGSYRPINVSPGSIDADDESRTETSTVTVGVVGPVDKETFLRALAEIFGDHGFLPEGMRTLEVTPSRVIEPGMVVRAAFTFRNLGGGTASGFRARFNLPDGMKYVSGTARIDETPLEESGGVSALLDDFGAEIGDVPAGSERRLALSLVVADALENGATVALQAAIAAADVPVIGSNIVKLVVHSVPILQNAMTAINLAALRQALPGEELQLSARIHNSGQSSAHDVVAMLPLPANTTYCANSATIDGKSTGSSPSVPFGFAQPTVVAPLLPPGKTVEVGYRVRIVTPLEDGTPITAQGAVCSQEIAEFALPPATLSIPSAPSFASAETSFAVDCGQDVEAGKRVRFILHAKNVGTAAARNVSLFIALPDGMLYTPGSLTIDGAPAPDDGIAPEALAIGDIEPGHSVELALSGIVRSPIANGRELQAVAAIEWSKGTREFERTIVARSAPRFPLEFNKIESEPSRRLAAGEAFSYMVSLHNMGTDRATDVRLALAADSGLERLRVYDDQISLALDASGTIALGSLEPGLPRSLRVEALVAATIADQTSVRLGATLISAQGGSVDLGSRIHIVDSRPVFTAMSSKLAVDGTGRLRFNETATLRLILANDGSDHGHDVRASLILPEALRFETVEGDATRADDAIVFGEIAPNERREARVTVRLVGMVGSSETLTLAARVSGRNVVPVTLRAVEIAAFAAASFSDGARLSASPAQNVDAGGEIEYTLTLRNSGAGSAKQLSARISTLSNAAYAQGSTVVNGIALADRAGTSVLLGQHGLQLADIGPGVEIVARWRVIVNMPLPPTATVDVATRISSDDLAEFSVSAAPVSVRSTSALPITDPALPFSILGATAAPARTASALPQLTSGETVTRRELGSGAGRAKTVREDLAIERGILSIRTINAALTPEDEEVASATSAARKQPRRPS